MDEQSDVFVVGAGYLGFRVAQLAAQQGVNVYATTRRKKRFGSLLRAGLRPVEFDWTDYRTFGNLPLRDFSANLKVLIAVSYDPSSRVSRYESQVGGMTRILKHLPGDARICYISTTGVFHQSDGGWVDETSPTHPNRLGGRVHLQAEQRLHAMRPQGAWNVLRLAGIYGPGRIPRVTNVLSGKPIESNPSGYLNLIHVQDAARSVLAAWDRMQSANATLASPTSTLASPTSRLFLVADDQPVLRGDFYREVARISGAAEPTFVAPSSTASARMRSDSNKRVWNRKLRRKLLTSLDFPDYRSGLADTLVGNLK